MILKIFNLLIKGVLTNTIVENSLHCDNITCLSTINISRGTASEAEIVTCRKQSACRADDNTHIVTQSELQQLTKQIGTIGLAARHYQSV